MQAVVENLGGLNRRVNLSVALAEIEGEVDKRLKRLARTVKVHGFRPGKVPLKVVAQQYGPQLRSEVLGEAVQKRFGEAVAESRLRVAGYPKIDTAGAAGEAMNFTATFEVYPEITVGDLSGKAIRRPIVAIGDPQIDATLEILRKQRVTFEPSDRGLATGDRVVIDYLGTMDGQSFPGGEGKDFSIVVGDGRTLKDFEAALNGAKAGEAKSFTMTFPTDYMVKDLAGRTASFDVTVKSVSAPRLPEVDAEFARTLGIADGDIAKMREEVGGNLQREVKRRVQAGLKEEVMQALLDVTPVEPPNALVSAEMDRLRQKVRGEMEARGLDAGKSPFSEEALADQASRRVRLGLVMAELVRTERLVAKPEQIRRLVEEFAQSYEHPDEVVTWYYAERDRLGEVENLAVEENIVAWVIERAKVEDEAVPFDSFMGRA